MTDIQAAIGREQLRGCPIDRRAARALAARYPAVRGIPASSPVEPAWARTNWQSYAVRLEPPLDQRARHAALLDDGIATRRGVMNAHREGAYPPGPGAPRDLDRGEQAQDTAIVLPLYHQMTDEDQPRVVVADAGASGSSAMISILTPAFNESANLEAVRASRAAAMTTAGRGLGVADRGRPLARRHLRRDRRLRGSRRPGPRRPARAQLRIARGDRLRAAPRARRCGRDDGGRPAGSAGDAAALLEQWRGGAQVVWATRRPGEKAHAGFAAIYYWIMRRIVGMKEMPARGADFFLVDRVVVDAFRRCDEQHQRVRPDHLARVPQEHSSTTSSRVPPAPPGGRSRGRSGLVIDSVTAFSDAPLRGLHTSVARC